MDYFFVFLSLGLAAAFVAGGGSSLANVGITLLPAAVAFVLLTFTATDYLMQGGAGDGRGARGGEASGQRSRQRRGGKNRR